MKQTLEELVRIGGVGGDKRSQTRVYVLRSAEVRCAALPNNLDKSCWKMPDTDPHVVCLLSTVQRTLRLFENLEYLSESQAV
eukprot:SAG31_NODE_2549_length_5519_cov_2.816605_5_plen_82_part_00